MTRCFSFPLPTITTMAAAIDLPRAHSTTHNITCAHIITLAHTQCLSHLICHFFTITILRTYNLYLTIFGLTPAQPLSHSQSHTFLTHNLTLSSRKLNQHDRRPFLAFIEPLVHYWSSCLQLGEVVIVDKIAFPIRSVILRRCVTVHMAIQ